MGFRQLQGVAVLVALLSLEGIAAAEAQRRGGPYVTVRSVGERHFASLKFCSDAPEARCTRELRRLPGAVRVRAGGTVRFALSRPAESFGVYSVRPTFGRIVRDDASGRYWTLHLPRRGLRRQQLGIGAEFKDGRGSLMITIVPARL